MTDKRNAFSPNQKGLKKKRKKKEEDAFRIHDNCQPILQPSSLEKNVNQAKSKLREFFKLDQ